MLNSANMYPWYRDSMSQLGQFCSGNNLPAPTAAHIKTEDGYSDCMLALDYAQNKVRIEPAQRLEIDARARSMLGKLMFIYSLTSMNRQQMYTLLMQLNFPALVCVNILKAMRHLGTTLQNKNF